VALRVRAVKLRDAYDRDPDGFAATWEAEEARLRRRIVAARKRLPLVEIADDVREAAATLCVSLGADGLRGEMTLLRAARACAALDGKPDVSMAHVRAIAPAALRHRLRRNPLDDTGSGQRVERALAAGFRHPAISASRRTSGATPASRRRRSRSIRPGLADLRCAPLRARRGPHGSRISSAVSVRRARSHGSRFRPTSRTISCSAGSTSNARWRKGARRCSAARSSGRRAAFSPSPWRNG
jgi:Mg-chelatase subunit ChlI